MAFKLDASGHESLLRTFTGQDGANPLAGLIRDSDGVLYGDTSEDGASGGGTVFKLTPRPNVCGAVLCPWNENVLHNFPLQQSGDGSQPAGDVIRDSAGNLYGTTYDGGNGCLTPGCGTVFKVDSQGNESVLWNFAGQPNDGASPIGSLLLDQMGNLYGTTTIGGNSNCGTVFVLSPIGSGWTERVIYSFSGNPDGCYPAAGLISDGQGNFYGTTEIGGEGYGVVFELSSSGESVLHTFTGPPDGAYPYGKLLLDSSGNLYSTTLAGGTTSSSCTLSTGCGTVFKLSPNGSGWTEAILWRFTGADGSNASGPVVMDHVGNLYGTAYNGGDLSATNPACLAGSEPVGCGVVFKITP